MERRVVITGLGAVTPIGNDVDTFWENLKAGKCGITKITKFDSTDFKAHVAAEVKDFDPLLYMDKGEVRKNDPFSQFAIAAATQAVNDSEIMGKIDPERFGVYFGSGIGGIQTFSNQMTALNEKGPRRVSAYFIPMLIANIAGGNIAIKFNAQGSCLPITTACATSASISPALPALWMRSAALRSITMLRLQGTIIRTRWARCRWTAKWR